jgi:hypothetical protein
MESYFGHDFRLVRVHTDARSAESAQAVNALAYTVGQDVVFGAGQYTPDTGQGQQLIAHELAHVVEQSAHSSGVPQLQRQAKTGLAETALRAAISSCPNIDEATQSWIIPKADNWILELDPHAEASPGKKKILKQPTSSGELEMDYPFDTHVLSGREWKRTRAHVKLIARFSWSDKGLQVTGGLFTWVVRREMWTGLLRFDRTKGKCRIVDTEPTPLSPPAPAAPPSRAVSPPSAAV